MLTHSYGNCVPFDSSSLDSETPCDDLFEQGVDYVYISNNREGGDLRSYLRFFESAIFAFKIAPDRCKREGKLLMCHYFLPPCGNSTVFEPPTSVCEVVCNYVRSLCPAAYIGAVDYFQQEHNVSLNCSNTGEYLETLPHCCSDVGVDVRTIDSTDPDSSSDGLVTGVATAVGALVVVIIVVVVVVVTVAYMMIRKRKPFQQKMFEEPNFFIRYLKFLFLCWHEFLNSFTAFTMPTLAIITFLYITIFFAMLY